MGLLKATLGADAVIFQQRAAGEVDPWLGVERIEGQRILCGRAGLVRMAQLQADRGDTVPDHGVGAIGVDHPAQPHGVVELRPLLERGELLTVEAQGLGVVTCAVCPASLDVKPEQPGLDQGGREERDDDEETPSSESSRIVFEGCDLPVYFRNIWIRPS